MNDFLGDSRTDTAFVWYFLRYDFRGDLVVSSRVKRIKVRLEQGYIETLDARGNKIAVPNMVKVGERIPVHSLMYFGDKLPDQVTNLQQVVELEEIPDLEGEEVDRWVKLHKYGDTLPTTAVN